MLIGEGQRIVLVVGFVGGGVLGCIDLNFSSCYDDDDDESWVIERRRRWNDDDDHRQ